MKKSLSLYDETSTSQVDDKTIALSEVDKGIAEYKQQAQLQTQMFCQQIEEKINTQINQQQLEFQQALKEMQELQNIINQIYKQLDSNKKLSTKIVNIKQFSEESKIQVLRNRIQAADKYLRDDFAFSEQQIQNATLTLDKLATKSQVQKFIDQQNEQKSKQLKQQLLQDKNEDSITKENTQDFDLTKLIANRRDGFRVSESVNASQSSKDSQIKESLNGSQQYQFNSRASASLQESSSGNQNLLQLKQSLHVMATPVVGTCKRLSIDDSL